MRQEGGSRLFGGEAFWILDIKYKSGDHMKGVNLRAQRLLLLFVSLFTVSFPVFLFPCSSVSLFPHASSNAWSSVIFPATVPSLPTHPTELSTRVEDF